MRWFLLLLIRIYQRWFRRLIRRTCIYSHSCSRFAAARLEDRTLPLYSTVMAVVRRVRGCGVSAIEVGREDGELEVRNRWGEHIPLDELAPHVLAQAHDQQARIREVPEVNLIFHAGEA